MTKKFLSFAVCVRNKHKKQQVERREKWKQNKKLADAILPFILATLWPGPNKPGANLLPFSMVAQKAHKIFAVIQSVALC